MFLAACLILGACAEGFAEPRGNERTQPAKITDFSSTTDISSASLAKLTLELERVVEAMGGEVTSSLAGVTAIQTVDGDKVLQYFGSVQLSFDGGPLEIYKCRFNPAYSLWALTPEALFIDSGIGYDTFEDVQTREKLTVAVEDFASQVGVKLYAGPFIQFIDEKYYLVSYEAVSDKDKEGRILLDPYWSALVNDKGTIYAFFPGA